MASSFIAQNINGNQQRLLMQVF